VAGQFDWAERPDVEDGWPPRMRARFELAQTDPAAALDLAAEQWTKFIEPEWRPEYRIEDLVEQMASESKPRIID